VMDTWATSSLTPQIAGHWDDDPDLFGRVFPMDVRPQGPEIIRTWLFATLLRSHYEHGVPPWAHAAINGWILDPERKKMSKSKGNVVTPIPLIEEYGAEAVRYWAALFDRHRQVRRLQRAARAGDEERETVRAQEGKQLGAVVEPVVRRRIHDAGAISAAARFSRALRFSAPAAPSCL